MRFPASRIQDDIMAARLVEAMRAATRIACCMLRGSAWFLPAISNAVP
jgi:hypothetical protein